MTGRARRSHRLAAEALHEEFGIPEKMALRVIIEARLTGLGVEAAARLLYASLDGRVRLDVCRSAASRMPLSPARP